MPEDSQSREGRWLADLKRRSVRGSVWVAGAQVASRLVSVARVVVIGRLLAPEDLGLFGLAMVVVGLLDAVSTTGFQAALVQKKHTNQAHYDAAWTAHIGRGALLGAIVVLASDLSAGFFSEAALASILPIIGIGLLIQGFVNSRVVDFQRDLEFHKEFLFQFLPLVLDLGVVVLAGLLLRNVWALVLGLLARYTLSVALSFVLTRSRPRLRIRGKEGRELFHFGKWMFLFGIVLFVINQSDKAVIGRVLTATEVGYYQMAFMIAMLPAMVMVAIVGRVGLPVYAKLQDNLDALRKAYLRVLEAGALVVFPVAVGLVVLAPGLVRVFLGAGWLSIVPVLRILSLKGLVWSLAVMTGGPLYMAVGRPDINFTLNLPQLLIFGLFLYPMALVWGVEGVAVVVVAGMVCNFGLNIVSSLRITGLRPSRYLGTLWHPLIGSVLAGIVAILADSLPGLGAVPSFFVSGLLLLTSYALWLVVSGRFKVLRRLLDDLGGR